VGGVKSVEERILPGVNVVSPGWAPSETSTTHQKEKERRELPGFVCLPLLTRVLAGVVELAICAACNYIYQKETVLNYI
jgi:hypothetical protein